MNCKRKFIAYRLIVVLAFIVLAAQLWRLQIVRGEQYRLMADRNRFRLVPLDAPRGVIYDRYGRILVRNVPSFSVTIVPAYLPKDERKEMAVFARLSALLGIPASRATASAGGVAPRKGIKEMVEEAALLRRSLG